MVVSSSLLIITRIGFEILSWLCDKILPNGCVKVLENILHVCVRLALMAMRIHFVVS